MKNKNNRQQQNSKPVAKKSKPFWRQPFTLLIGVFFTLGLVAFGFNFNKKEVIKQTETESKTALHYFKNPHDLIQVWDTTVPFPKQFYSETEVSAQQQINEKTEDGIITFSPLDKEKEWEKIDFEEITPFTWKWIDLELTKEDGTLSKIKLRRPHWWFKELKADSIGKKVYLDMSEMGIVGFATVKNIRINQLDTRFWNENRKGDYVSRPITGKFEHESNEVYYLHFGDNPEPLGVTGSHPIWSIDRNDWVEASGLKIGEKVKTQESLTVLKSRTKSDKTQKVYNLEIYKDHNFLVSMDKILVHNSCFEPVVLKNGLKGGKQINKEIKEIVEGRGTPRFSSDGSHTIFENRNNTPLERKWGGAFEYQVDVPNMPNNYRILRLQNGVDDSGNAIYKYGYTTDHYQTIHEFVPKTN